MKVYNKLDEKYKKNFVSVAISGYHNQIKKMQQPEQYRFLMVELPIIARAYGAKKILDNSTYKECVKIVITKFGFLSIADIREAYRQFASGEIVTKSGEMYWGEFNSLNLARVLSEYNKSRKKIVAEFLRIIQNEKEKEMAEDRQIEMERRFNSGFTQMLEDGKNTFDKWQQVPAYWYKSCMKRNLFDLEKMNANAIYAKAGELVHAEMLEEAQNPYKSIIDQVDTSEMQKRIARKLAVWIHILGKELNLELTQNSNHDHK